MRYFGTDTQEARVSLLSGFALLVLVFSVTRGLVPILTSDANLANPTYFVTAVLGATLSCHGLYIALSANSGVIGKWPLRLLLANFLFFLVWLVSVIVFNSEFEFILREGIASVVYAGLFPFSIYAFIKIPQKVLVPALGFVTLVVSMSVIFDFVLINTTTFLPGGYELALKLQTLLRPDVFEGYTRTGPYVRPNGLFGHRPHDSGNMLAILFVYWLAMLFKAKEYVFPVSVIASLALVGLLYTQSASNIIASFVGVSFVLVMVLKWTGWRNRLFWKPGAIFVLTLIAVLFVLFQFGIGLEALWVWSIRITPWDGDWKGMTAIGADDVLGDLFAVLFGHGSTLQISRIADVTEIGMLKGIIEHGIVHQLTMYALLLYPVVIFLRKRQSYPTDVLPLAYVAAVIVGVLSLWHYGSVLRTTNVFVFFALYAHALRVFNRIADHRVSCEKQAGLSTK